MVTVQRLNDVLMDLTDALSGAADQGWWEGISRGARSVPLVLLSHLFHHDISAFTLSNSTHRSKLY
jgi:hypothetical protein